eukprot:scaffold24337_cov82-Cyclotella_meneghiniana.AAC.7
MAHSSCHTRRVTHSTDDSIHNLNEPDAASWQPPFVRRHSLLASAYLRVAWMLRLMFCLLSCRLASGGGGTRAYSQTAVTR